MSILDPDKEPAAAGPSNPIPPDPGPSRREGARRTTPKPRRGEKVIEWWMFFCAAISVLTTVGIVTVLLGNSLRFFDEVSVFEFLTGTRWAPLFEPRGFGVLPLIAGTAMIVVISGVIALPMGLAIGLYLSEYASPLQRKIIKPFMEILAGIPTIVYGYFALTFITPLLQKIYAPTEIFNGLSGGIVVGIMILPMVASLSEDALRAVPDTLRQGGYALGASSFHVSLTIVTPAALSGISSAFILALSRAIGETMAVTIAAGATPNLTANPFEGIQTMTAFIVQISKGDTPAGTVEYYTLFAVALLLFLITFAMNVVANRIQRRYREVYDS
ncbi:MAG: phosphate ABC transporter permease subunit PstC [Sumerlaeia bacterium]